MLNCSVKERLSKGSLHDSFVGIFVHHAFIIYSRGGVCRIPPHNIRHALNRIRVFFCYLDEAKIVLWPWFISLLLLTSPDSPQSAGGLFSRVSFIQIDGRPLHKNLASSLRRRLVTSPISLPREALRTDLRDNLTGQPGR
ncbi:hypothetical protein PHYBLDRAFT_139021 [Phycomyces blakesleeanus NRRL 1555(-)]|uniref:Uncharacterized protein n=1 Tax=Phycomyces blakesleeanus (strain ATCC 8743b / DSM 1359 / FGSC 10004 / NBRC 33097 / NRRL 1555) TaxID=763407 RepID=A0A163ETI9_PHYB8|nr:hypothetical protein PHYBLDRAFT_139021 [Phycomyces blakesleeanus NRRL 1555(-)]OAD81470.1 hypothetical protein PHYBLDRAFT_139021 [Phycomyces blakesleeanus NRRL 1555(-)]|eukprot:XP_018299510.1 hypothetical protein PHYBLDRAFT_139021 [Phycomyces blakesleeanus NRRL 1555(-)]